MWRSLLLLLPSLLAAEASQVELRDSEVWLIKDGQAKQLTRDGKSKGFAALCASRTRAAYTELCPEAEHCMPSVVVLDLDGRRAVSFHPGEISENACGSIMSMEWTGEGTIAAECHINPSLNEYVETDISTGKVTRDLLGYGFTPSPDGKLVAHAGWIVHFGPQYAKSNYLQVDHATIYPLPEGTGPVEQVGLIPPPKVIRMKGTTYVGIHEFQSGLHWSPDSRRIALIDCTHDWTPNHPATLTASDGTESDRRCSVAAVSTTGKVTRFALPAMSPADLYKAGLVWVGPHRLSIETGSFTRTYPVP
jgi:hypothetical protein